MVLAGVSTVSQPPQPLLVHGLTTQDADTAGAKVLGGGSRSSTSVHQVATASAEPLSTVASRGQAPIVSSTAEAQPAAAPRASTGAVEIRRAVLATVDTAVDGLSHDDIDMSHIVASPTTADVAIAPVPSSGLMEVVDDGGSAQQVEPMATAVVPSVAAAGDVGGVGAGSAARVVEEPAGVVASSASLVPAASVSVAASASLVGDAPAAGNAVLDTVPPTSEPPLVSDGWNGHLQSMPSTASIADSNVEINAAPSIGNAANVDSGTKDCASGPLGAASDPDVTLSDVVGGEPGASAATDTATCRLTELEPASTGLQGPVGAVVDSSQSGAPSISLPALETSQASAPQAAAASSTTTLPPTVPLVPTPAPVSAPAPVLATAPTPAAAALVSSSVPVSTAPAPVSAAPAPAPPAPGHALRQEVELSTLMTEEDKQHVLAFLLENGAVGMGSIPLNRVAGCRLVAG